MIDVIVRPWNIWPGEKTDWPRRAPFRTLFSKTSRLLESELRQIGAEEAVLELAITESDIRRDGWVKENARPFSQGVILSFTSEVTGPVRYPCDTFYDWQDNVRAIALALQALRAVDRYGVTKRGEQYAGWKQLPGSTGPTMTSTQAAAILSTHSDLSSRLILAQPDVAKEAVRLARKRTHPDSTGGAREAWDSVDAALSILTSHHGVSL